MGLKKRKNKQNKKTAKQPVISKPQQPIVNKLLQPLTEKLQPKPLTEKSQPTHYGVVREIMRDYEKREFSEPLFNISYDELVQHLLTQYGPVNAPYVKFTKDKNSCYRNPDLQYPQSDLQIHHIAEDRVPYLSRMDVAVAYPLYQQPEFLVYANIKEHTILHFRIAIEYGYGKGLGGLLNFGLGIPKKGDLSWKEDYLIMLARLMSRFPCKPCLDLFDSVFHNKPIQLQPDLKAISKNFNAHIKIVEQFPVGISVVSGQFYNDNVCESKTIKKLNEVYVLRTNNNNTATAYKTKSGHISLLCGGSFDKTNFYDINCLFKHLDEILHIEQDFNNKINSILIPLSDYIKSIGGTGRIHGLIVDVDFTRHIMLNVENDDFKLIGYESSIFDWCDNHTIHIQDTPMALIESFNTHSNEVAIVKNHSVMLSNMLNSTSKLSNTSIQAVRAINSEAADLYMRSRKILRIQQSFEFNHLVHCPDIYNEDYDWGRFETDYFCGLIENSEN